MMTILHVTRGHDQPKTLGEFL
ncbi:hypothetical protein CNECB9_1320027 [Cupriavidus necator]|uniref:Uncharacterized protein n=1 Tax=Cupriavidus necator TaxID=106590 RepID=A0A1K0J3Z1_CUPNE|nr:hypothetical protein CNECB9_1320027 [Cupriavidus necator]